MLHKPKQFQLSNKLRMGVGRKANVNTYLKYASTFFIVVAVGLSFNTGRLLFGSMSGDSPKNDNPQVLGLTDTKDITAPKTSEFVIYKVQKGDTLFSIAQHHNISWTTLATLNNIDSPFTVSTGQEIRVPKQQ